MNKREELFDPDEMEKKAQELIDSGKMPTDEEFFRAMTKVRAWYQTELKKLRDSSTNSLVRSETRTTTPRKSRRRK